MSKIKMVRKIIEIYVLYLATDYARAPNTLMKTAHVERLRSAHTGELDPGTIPLKSLYEGAGHRDLSHEQFTRSVLKNKSQGTSPKNSNWFEFVGLDFEAKMASSHDGTCPCNLLQVLVAGTSLITCAGLNTLS